ncbi:reverse transcriptase [Gossypium australe]|uniref:Reverse transcriptase n=1 Tax=Gossypium australe TaxID=47621 RepID=A0A5B6US50_9ROSI|nr:reverse transcriptase [Gossypium australe]
MSFDIQHVKTTCAQTHTDIAELKKEKRNIVSALNEMRRRMGTGLDELEIVFQIEKRPESMAELEKTPRKELVQKNVSFPSRLKDKQIRDEKEFVSFLNLFKSFNVNLALLELIDRIPKYEKYLKEIMSRYKRLEKGEQIKINASCSAIIARKIPPKLKYLGNFTIPIEIGNEHFSKPFVT